MIPMSASCRFVTGPKLVHYAKFAVFNYWPKRSMPLAAMQVYRFGISFLVAAIASCTLCKRARRLSIFACDLALCLSSSMLSTASMASCVKTIGGVRMDSDM